MTIVFLVIVVSLLVLAVFFSRDLDRWLSERRKGRWEVCGRCSYRNDRSFCTHPELSEVAGQRQFDQRCQSIRLFGVSYWSERKVTSDDPTSSATQAHREPQV